MKRDEEDRKRANGGEFGGWEGWQMKGRGVEHCGSGDVWSLRGPLVVWDKSAMVKAEAGL